MLQKTLTITSDSGLHARPSTVLVKAASSFDSDIFIEYKGKRVNLKSIMGVMSLGIGQGAEITIVADGSDEADAMQKIEDTFKEESLGE